MPTRSTGFVLLLAAAALVIPPAGAQAGHVTCGDVVTADTTLDSDLVDCPGDGIVIGAAGITLDLNGHTVDGDGGPAGEPGCDTGIVNGRWDRCTEPPNQPGHEGVTVRDGTVQEFPAGVQLQEASGYALVRLRVSESRGPALAVLQSSRGRIENNVVSGAFPGSGALISESSDSSIVGNVLTGNAGCGIELWDTNDRNRIERNDLSRNAGCGIFARGSRATLLARNSVWENGGAGLYLADGVSDSRIAANRVVGNAGSGIALDEGPNRNRVERNTVLRNGDAGLVVTEGDENLIRGNHVTASSGHGIHVRDSGSEHNLVAANHATGNGADGINVGADATGTVLRRNFVHRNDDDGIEAADPFTTVAGNLANWNGDLGIEAVAGVGDGGGNRASGNGNRLQCLNVACK